MLRSTLPRHIADPSVRANTIVSHFIDNSSANSPDALTIAVRYLAGIETDPPALAGRAIIGAIMNQTLILAGRVLLAAIFVVSGFGKLAGAQGFAGFLTQLGFPAPLAMAYLVGAFELLGGLAVIVGFQTRIVGVALALFCVATGLLVHAGDQTALLKNIAIAGGFLVLAGSGAGSIAVDKTARERRYA